VKSAPEEGKSATEEGKSAPEEGKSAPEEGKSAPEEGKSQKVGKSCLYRCRTSVTDSITLAHTVMAAREVYRVRTKGFTE
jgi:hypothetical protein